MEEQEDDYMSEDILNLCTQNDIRPGLLHSQKQKRELEIFKRKRETEIPSFRVIAEERREEGLQTALSDDNKGFIMLQKMGYQVGSGIGKNATGTAAPIKIEIKTDNRGLGHSSIREKTEREPAMTTEEYRKTLVQRREMTETKMDFLKSKRICRNFDIKDNLKKPITRWFWPDEQPNSSDEASDSSEPEILSHHEMKQRLKIIIMYLREKYNYCMWCGSQFDDERDLAKECPGRSKRHHDEDEQAASSTDADSD